MPSRPADNPSSEGLPARADEFAEALQNPSRDAGGAPAEPLLPPEVIDPPLRSPVPLPNVADDREPTAPEPPEVDAAGFGDLDDMLARVIEEVDGLGRGVAASSRPAAIEPRARKQVDLLRQVLGEVDGFHGGPDRSLTPAAPAGSASRDSLEQLLAEVDDLVEPSQRPAGLGGLASPPSVDVDARPEAYADEADEDQNEAFEEEEFDVDDPDAVDVAAAERDLDRPFDLPSPSGEIEAQGQLPPEPAITGANQPAPPPPEMLDAPAAPAGAAPDLAPQEPSGSTASPLEPAGASTQIVDMAQLDQAIAEDVDTLMPGGYESVDDVLQGVFEEVATLVQEAENAPAVVHGSAEHKPAAPVPAPADPAAAAPASAGARPPEPADTDPPGQREKAPPEPTDRIVELKRRALSVWSVAEPTVVRVLEGVNYPLRLLPDPMRQIVDWIALTLVFWVPITWVIALFVIG